MRPETHSRRLFGITRSKGKMYELGLPEPMHIAVPAKSEPQELFILTVGTLGDAAATLNDAANSDEPLPPPTMEDLGFSASFFDAFLESRFSAKLARDTALLAASAYYIARRPGSSLVVARRLETNADDSPVAKLLHWVLLAHWGEYPANDHPLFGSGLEDVANLLTLHFHDGSRLATLTSSLNNLRLQAYKNASARDLLFIDLTAAIVRIRLSSSVWTTLPVFTGIKAERWAPAIRRREFPKELWPSQLLLGKAGIFSGVSGVVQMPTSAGKTRSVEIILRSGFLSSRTNLAVVVAPFRALCHEIGTSLRQAFSKDDVNVNELSDAMQLDFLAQAAEAFGAEIQRSQNILVMTPEKFLYVLRQIPSLVKDIGIVIYDEGHQFDSGSRGITYELLLTEIKSLLQPGAQTILISAVIQNAKAIGEWLMGDSVQVVNGNGLLPTARSVAFTSWIERLGQLMFYESNTYVKHDYFVPRVIEQTTLARRGRERTARYFPETDNSNDVALYLGFRLVSQGAVAIFCGLKATASGLASRAVEVFEREFALAPPAASANEDELQRMQHLIDAHFGSQSITSKAAALGIFVHHGTTPHGLRLCIEHAMQKGLINFVACTSTLAQGVNLPIRYLIVPGIYQAGDEIKVRDFQNLVGRAGRSGMHTEGLIIFSNPRVYDERQSAPWKFKASVKLLSPASSESTTSSLLGLLDPLCEAIDLSTEQLCSLLLSGRDGWVSWANDLVCLNQLTSSEAKTLVTELRRRRRLIFALESYLMANRGSGSLEEFLDAAEQLATATLAHHLASDSLKPGMRMLFNAVAKYVHRQEPSPEKQVGYSKTLLGVKSAKAVERWVADNRNSLLSFDSNEAWLHTVWELFSALLEDKFFHTVKPEALPLQIASLWLQGYPYHVLFEHSGKEKGTKAWGENKCREVTGDDIVDLCENTLGFECSLILAAVAQFLFGENSIHEPGAEALILFQKALKYGLPDWLSISCYELGFADRAVAQRLAHAVRAAGFSEPLFASAIESQRERIESVLKEYPSYFNSVLLARG